MSWFRVDRPQKFIQVVLFLFFVQPIGDWLSQTHWLNVCFPQSSRGKKTAATILTWSFFCHLTVHMANALLWALEYPVDVISVSPPLSCSIVDTLRLVLWCHPCSILIRHSSALMPICENKWADGESSQGNDSGDAFVSSLFICFSNLWCINELLQGGCPWNIFFV